MRFKTSSLLAKFMIASLLLTSTISGLNTYNVHADGEEAVLMNDFEDNSFNGWSPLGGTGKLVIDTSTANTGNACMKISERTQSWNGPAYNAINILECGSKYTFEAYVYHESEVSEALMWSIKFVGSDGIDAFHNIASVDVPPNQWTIIKGTIEIPQDTISIITYLEALTVELDFCVDDVKITQVGGSGSSGNNNNNNNNNNDNNANNNENEAENENSVDNNIIIDQNEYKYSFEEDFEKWLARGEIRLMRNDRYFTEGQYSLFVDDRAIHWHGPSVNIDFIQRNIPYNYSADVMFNDENAPDSQDFQLNLQYEFEGNMIYQEVARETLKKGDWKTLSGSFTVPVGVTNVVLYLQTPESSDDSTDNLLPFYVDNVIVSDPTANSNAKSNNMLIIYIIAAVAIILIIVATIILRKKSSGNTQIRAYSNDENSSFDAMTQALDKNSYEQKAIYLEDHPEECKNLHIALCDINFLGYINEHYGHEKGDEAIIRCAQIFLRAAGKKGTVYRTGGDEFMCMSDVSLEEDIKRELEIETQSYQGYPFFVAIGFANADTNLDSDLPDIKQIITRADKAMYENKLTLKAKHSPQNR